MSMVRNPLYSSGVVISLNRISFIFVFSSFFLSFFGSFVGLVFDLFISLGCVFTALSVVCCCLPFCRLLCVFTGFSSGLLC